MSQQPATLRLADQLDADASSCKYAASFELRRLHRVEIEAIALRAQVERLRVEADNHLADLKDAAEKVERLQAAGQVAAPAMVPLTDERIEAAAIVLAACMDYPWSHMPEQGRQSMRIHARSVIEAASANLNGLTVGALRAQARTAGA